MNFEFLVTQPAGCLYALPNTKKDHVSHLALSCSKYLPLLDTHNCRLEYTHTKLKVAALTRGKGKRVNLAGH